ncbi:hypothetical protein H632_c5483p0 [Helicosporidium sp. ATCC 50920]|nr:hypothetical protein H632_c5483p0 [Helicosporidium sp. ATCC 50920]|eukprot:KDD71239.1 hypothetical protein H632_c5483p0 [Helicosporidium sp. ATCC 50920]
MLPNLLQTLFETVFLEDCSNQWSLSRPMLSLMLLDPAGLAAVQRKIVAAQPAERHARLAACFEKLMQGVEPALESKNRDKFTQNLTVVRQEFRSKT